MNKLTSNTLVLNRSWLAVQICSVRRAVSLLYQGHARVVDEDFQAYGFKHWSQVSQQIVEVSADEFICSPSVKLKIPRVIVLQLYDKLPSREVSFSRRNIFERDKYTCQYCGKKPKNKKTALKWMEENILNLDHVIPRSRGGKTTWSNIVSACYGCNTKKGNKLLQEVGWKLKKQPIEPKWQPTVRLGLKVRPHKQWVNFLDLAYYNLELENDNED